MKTGLERKRDHELLLLMRMATEMREAVKGRPDSSLWIVAADALRGLAKAEAMARVLESYRAARAWHSFVTGKAK